MEIPNHAPDLIGNITRHCWEKESKDATVSQLEEITIRLSGEQGIGCQFLLFQFGHSVPKIR